MFYFIYLVHCAIYGAIFVNHVFLSVNIEGAKVFRNTLTDIKLYVVNTIIEININVSKIFYIAGYSDRIHDIWVEKIIINMHILEIIVLENVVDEAIIISLVVIIIT